MSNTHTKRVTIKIKAREGSSKTNGIADDAIPTGKTSLQSEERVAKRINRKLEKTNNAEINIKSVKVFKDSEKIKS